MEGDNVLEVTLDVPSAGGCGLLATGHISAGLRPLRSIKLAAGCSSVDCIERVELPRLASGTVILAQQLSTNKAGLAATVTLPNLVMIDESPPSQAVVRGCAFGGIYNRPTGIYSQRSQNGLGVCFQPDSAAFADTESGLWLLEWQLARWVADGSGVLGAPLETLLRTWEAANSILAV